MDSTTAATVGTSEDSQLRWLHRHSEVMHFGERLRYDAVVRPAAFLSIADQARFLQNAKMERETRLRGIEIVLQVAHALIPAPQLLDDSQPGLIGERVEEPDGSRMIDRRTRHTSNVSTFVGTSMAAGTPH